MNKPLLYSIGCILYNIKEVGGMYVDIHAIFR